MNYELPTKDGKKIKLVNPCIVVSQNDRIDSGYFVEIKLLGTLPGCRKAETLTITPYTDSISITTLFNYRKHCSVAPEEMRKLINTVPVGKYAFAGAPFVLTDEIRDFARKHVEEICDCPAVKGAK